MSAPRALRLGVAGLGRAFTLMLPTLERDGRIALVAGADPREAARARFARDHGARVYADVEALCADPDVEAIYVATPHQFHRTNVESAARHGKHALVEKPMALSLEDCAAMIEVCERAGVAMVVGHSHSFDRPIARARALVASGALGRLRMINALQYTDFLYRPRRAEELDTAHGGGVIFNQAPHQVDNVRLIAGGRVRSVRASAGAFDAGRRTEGAYAAHLTFEDGAFATLAYSGYAHFDSDEFTDWIAESGLRKDPAQYGVGRTRLRGVAPHDEEAVKARQNYGGPDYAPPPISDPRLQRFHQHFGLLIASCERGDIRPQPHGMAVYGDEARRFEPLDPPGVPRVEVMDEFCAAVFERRPALHDGRWAMATMEVCFAILDSARESREIRLVHQCGLPPGF